MDSDIYKTPQYSGTHGNTKTAIATVTSISGELDRLMPAQMGTTILSITTFGAAGTAGYETESASDASALNGSFAPFTFTEDGDVTYTPSASGAMTAVITYI